MHREIETLPRRGGVREGRRVVAAIGIDRYREWPRLGNAVNDAFAASQMFVRLGFEQVTAPLLDEAATGDALRRLVTDDLAQLSADDSLVLFFAGHGHTHLARFGSISVKTGCVIPVDATRLRGHISASWLRLDSWLSDIARLPPRHILVIVDACYSGVALSSLHKWRDVGSWLATRQAALQLRRSRRIITSALDDQRAMDSGPVAGHSLFTGCLLEGLSGGLAKAGRRVVTGRELGQYLQQRVAWYPESTQTPDFGTFELDDRGDILLPILGEEDERTSEISTARTIPRVQPPRSPTTTIPGLGPAALPRPSEQILVYPGSGLSRATGPATTFETAATSARLVTTSPGVGPPPQPSHSTPVLSLRSVPQRHKRSDTRKRMRRRVAAILALCCIAMAIGYALGPAGFDSEPKEPPPAAMERPTTDAGLEKPQTSPAVDT